MSNDFAFVCARADELDEQHATTGVMIQCTHCGKFVVGGYVCDDCEHRDVDSADQLVGHGPGKCVATWTEVSADAP